jgi:tRNA(Ile)-lysidine synthetase-like protein
VNIDVEPGIYVLAVSGGVDSMVLLDLAAGLAKNKKQKTKKGQASSHYRFVVAHFDHGIREDSEQDRLLVARAAKHYGLPFVFDEAQLGPGTSEATARKARYDFLRRIQGAAGANAIVTAHHEDDLIETAILNLLRGTGRKGLTSLADSREVRRPLLGYSKKQLHAYATKQGLRWHEDSTNKDMAYKRNYIRQNIVAKMKPEERRQLLGLLAKTKETNKVLDGHIADLLQAASTGKTFDKRLFTSLPHKVALEVMAAWLRSNDIRQFDKKLLERLSVQAKALAPGKKVDIDTRYCLVIQREKLQISHRL